jgi:hypothetical protein
MSLDFPSPCGESPQAFPVIFILELLRNLPASTLQKVLLMRPGETSDMEEFKMPVWARDKMFPHKQGAFFHSQSRNQQ